jgi:4-aminobutyrate aminotransferase-like enzyme
LASRIQAKCLENKMLILTCGTFGNVIRWIPPLVVTKQQIEDSLVILEGSIEELVET